RRKAKHKGEDAWRFSSEKANIPSKSTRTGRKCLRKSHSATAPQSASTGKIAFMPSTAASTRSPCSMPKAICCAPAGEGVFRRPHGVHMGPDETVWLTDDGDHTVRKCTLGGKVLMTLGVPGEPKPYMSGEPFHRCTHTAMSPRGDLYVSDGYGN